MKIQIMSDLHLEFRATGHKLRVPTAGDVLVLAGDIAVAKKGFTYGPFFDSLIDRFEHIIYVMGNHEHYGGSILKSKKKIEETIDSDKVTVLENSVKVIDGVAFIGGTLWTNYNNGNFMDMFYADQFMNDHKCIRTGDRIEPHLKKFRTKDAYTEHTKTHNFIFEEIPKHDKCVVVTHHAPSQLSIPDQFKGDKTNCAFASDLSLDIIDSKPNVWIHGHTHSSFDYILGKTRVICNPRGYAPDDLNMEFDITKSITI